MLDRNMIITILNDLKNEIQSLNDNLFKRDLAPERRKELKGYIQYIDALLSADIDFDSIKEKLVSYLIVFIKKELAYKHYASIILYYLTKDKAINIAEHAFTIAQENVNTNYERYLRYSKLAFDEFSKAPDDANRRNYYLGIAYHEGLVVKKDINKAIKFFEKEQVYKAAANSRLLQIYGYGSHADAKKFDLCKRKILNIDFGAYLYLGHAEMHEYAFDKKAIHIAQAKEYYKKAYSPGGSFQALCELAKLYANEGNYEEAINLLVQVDSEPQANYMMYEFAKKGKATSANHYFAMLSYLNKAKESNYPPALFEYGTLCYQYRNYSEAVNNIELAANTGFEPAQAWMGKYLLRTNAKENVEKAIHYLTVAAYKGNPYAAYDLAKYYLRHQNTTEQQKAIEFLSIIEINAQALLQGRQEDIEKAKMYYLLGKASLLTKEKNSASKNFELALALGYEKAAAKIAAIKQSITLKVLPRPLAFFNLRTGSQELDAFKENNFYDEKYLDPIPFLEAAQKAFAGEDYHHVLAILDKFENSQFSILDRIKAKTLCFDAYKALAVIETKKAAHYKKQAEETRKSIVQMAAQAMLLCDQSEKAFNEYSRYQSLYLRPGDLRDFEVAKEEPTTSKTVAKETKEEVEVAQKATAKPSAANKMSSAAAKKKSKGKVKPQTKNMDKAEVVETKQEKAAAIPVAKQEEADVEVKATIDSRISELVSQIAKTDDAIVRNIVARLIQLNSMEKCDLLFLLFTHPQANEIIHYLNASKLINCFTAITNDSRFALFNDLLLHPNSKEIFNCLLVNGSLCFFIEKYKAYFSQNQASLRHLILLETVLEKSASMLNNGQQISLAVLYACICWTAIYEKSKGIPSGLASTYQHYDQFIVEAMGDLKTKLAIPMALEVTIAKILRLGLYQVNLYKGNPFVFLGCEGVFLRAIIFADILKAAANTANKCMQPVTTLQSISLFSTTSQNELATGTAYAPKLAKFENWFELVTQCEAEGRLDALLQICQGRADVSALHILAGLRKHVLIEKLLTEMPATDLNKQDVYGGTVLHVAAKTNDLTLLKILLDKGASSLVIDAEGNLPLHYAYSSGLNLLLNHYDFKSLAVTEKVKHALHAAKNGYNGLAATILEAIDLSTPDACLAVNQFDKNGKNILYYAIKNDAHELVKLLLVHNRDMNVDVQNKTPFELALSANANKALDVLKDIAAKREQAVGDKSYYATAKP